MTLSEFKAWFEGFTENLDGPPSAEQWKRIQKRVKEISGQTTSYPVFVDRYYEPYRRWYYGPVTTGAGTLSCTATSSAAAAQNGGGASERTIGYQSGTLAAREFDSHKAMAAIGRAEAQSLAA